MNQKQLEEILFLKDFSYFIAMTKWMHTTRKHY